jgi:hypothetical protein
MGGIVGAELCLFGEAFQLGSMGIDEPGEDSVVEGKPGAFAEAAMDVMHGTGPSGGFAIDTEVEDLPGGATRGPPAGPIKKVEREPIRTDAIVRGEDCIAPKGRFLHCSCSPFSHPAPSPEWESCVSSLWLSQCVMVRKLVTRHVTLTGSFREYGHRRGERKKKEKKRKKKESIRGNRL